MRILFFVLLGLLTHSAFAIDFLQIICVPEAAYFEVGFKAVDEHDNFFGTFDPKDEKKCPGILRMERNGVMWEPWKI